MRKRFADSGLVATKGEGLYPGLTLDDHLRQQRAEIEWFKQTAEAEPQPTAEPEIASIAYESGKLEIKYRDPKPKPPEMTLEARLQAPIDLHDRWVSVIEDTKRLLEREYPLFRDDRSSENRDQTERNRFLGAAFAFWCQATGAMPPIEGRWSQKAEAISFLTKAAEPVVGELPPSAIRNWLTAHVALVRRWARPKGWKEIPRNVLLPASIAFGGVDDDYF